MIDRRHAKTAGRLLSSLGLGERARVERIDGGAFVTHRLRMFGIRPGVDVRVVHGPNRRGAVVLVGGGRIALGRDVIEHILVAPEPVAGAHGGPGGPS